MFKTKGFSSNNSLKRRAIIVDAPDLPPEEAEFYITNVGIADTEKGEVPEAKGLDFEVEALYEEEKVFRSRRGYLQDEMVIRHFNGELKPNFTQVFAEIVEQINQWITSHKSLHEYVEVELVREVGEDFIILPFHKSYSTLNAIEDWDEHLIPEELEIMRKILGSEIGNPGNEKEKIIEEILVRSLLEPSGKTWFYETINKFIITEPRITLEHLEKWSILSNEQS